MIKSQAQVFLHGRMEGSTRVSGLMAISMGGVCILIKNKFQKSVNGVKVKD